MAYLPPTNSGPPPPSGSGNWLIIVIVVVVIVVIIALLVWQASIAGNSRPIQGLRLPPPNFTSRTVEQP